MAYNGQFNNNTREKQSTNTSGLQFYNSEGEHKSTLKYDFWDKFISIKIHPALPADKMTDNEKFDYDQSAISALNSTKALVLVKHIDEIIENDYVAKGIKFCKGVPIGNNHGIFVGVNTPRDGGDAYAYVMIARNIDPETKKPETAMYFQFVPAISVEYDIETGNNSVDKLPSIDLELLRNALFNDAITLAGATAHSIRHIDKWYRDQIATAVGVKKGGNGGGGHQYNSTSVFGGGGAAAAGETRTSTVNRETLSNFSDIGEMTNM